VHSVFMKQTHSTQVWKEILVKEWPWHKTITEAKNSYKSRIETMWPPASYMTPVVNSWMQFRKRHIKHWFICWTIIICNMGDIFVYISVVNEWLNWQVDIIIKLVSAICCINKSKWYFTNQIYNVHIW
jgi:hypothetical protein